MKTPWGETIMPDTDIDSAATPEEVSPTTTGPLRTVGGEGTRGWVRVVLGMCVATLLLGDVFLYSHHQALQARVENQERRIERLDKVVSDLLLANENAEKIEKIEQQVDGIDGQVQELTKAIKAQNAKAEEPAPDPEPKKRKPR